MQKKIVYADAPPPRGSVAPHSFSAGCTLWAGKRATSQWRNWQPPPQPGDPGQQQQWGVMLTVRALDNDVMTKHISAVIFLPQTHNPSLIVRKNSRQIPTEGERTRHLTGVPQSCQSHQIQEKPEKLSAKRCLMRHNVEPQMGSWKRKGTLGKN